MTSAAARSTLATNPAAPQRAISRPGHGARVARGQQHAHPVVVGRELLREGDPVAVGQVDVEQQRVRARLGDGGARLREARGLADDP